MSWGLEYKHKDWPLFNLMGVWVLKNRGVGVFNRGVFIIRGLPALGLLLARGLAVLRPGFFGGVGGAHVGDMQNL